MIVRRRLARGERELGRNDKRLRSLPLRSGRRRRRRRSRTRSAAEQRVETAGKIAGFSEQAGEMQRFMGAVMGDMRQRCVGRKVMRMGGRVDRSFSMGMTARRLVVTFMGFAVMGIGRMQPGMFFRVSGVVGGVPAMRAGGVIVSMRCMSDVGAMTLMRNLAPAAAQRRGVAGGERRLVEGVAFMGLRAVERMQARSRRRAFLGADFGEGENVVETVGRIA